MKPMELAVSCAAAIARGHETVMLTIPKGGVPRGFPRGEVANEYERGGVVEVTRWHDAARVLAWLERNGLVGVRVEDGKLVLSEPAC